MKRVKLLTALLASSCLLFSVDTFAQQTLLPKPQKLSYQDGKLKAKSFSLKSEAIPTKNWSEVFEMPFSEKGKIIELQLVDTLLGVKQNHDEAYKLIVNKDQVELEAQTEEGLFRGLQTFDQLVQEHGKKGIPCMEILDWPAFKVRGFMQDVGRSFVSLEELKREIEVLAKYKVNVFHWHLTENQAWRLESKRYPELIAKENMTRMQGKFYTHEEARELQEFCKKHHVTLIPEIDMPGHSAAFVRAFKVDMQSKEGMVILKDLMDEVCEVLDEVPYIHIGTDEVRFTNMTFCDEMVAFLRERGKKVMSWNPGWNYKKGEIDMTHMWSYRGKPTPGIPTLDSKFHYLNHFDNFADIVGLYTSRIGNRTNGNESIAGSILAIWHDRYIDDEQDMIIQNHLYPNMLALAERAWCGGGWQYYDEFGTNLQEGTEPFKAFCDFEDRMLWHKDRSFQNLPFGYVKQTDVEWNISDAFPNEGDLTKKFEPETNLLEEYSYDGQKINVRKAIGAGIYLRHVWGDLIPTFYKDPKENHTAYAWTYVYSPKKQDVGLWFETQNYGRSEMDLPPPQGEWDYRHSKLWINDEEIKAPKWTATHTKKSNEISLGNENMVVRDPLNISLEKGWNKVLIKLPMAKFSSPQIRLVKWMFSFSFVTPDGKDRVDNLIYSTKKTKK